MIALRFCQITSKKKGNLDWEMDHENIEKNKQTDELVEEPFLQNGYHKTMSYKNKSWSIYIFSVEALDNPKNGKEIAQNIIKYINYTAFTHN